MGWWPKPCMSDSEQWHTSPIHTCLVLSATLFTQVKRCESTFCSINFLPCGPLLKLGWLPVALYILHKLIDPLSLDSFGEQSQSPLGSAIGIHGCEVHRLRDSRICGFRYLGTNPLHIPRHDGICKPALSWSSSREPFCKLSRRGLRGLTQ